ncbi:MAG: adenylosuccinate lyase [Bacteroidetes bacterium]|nr:adenylosuccinate lyase [Bacteroidota bacterium]MBK6838812.1 adenylosuccinate lyase [Bacteroidota bacterium]MBL0257162.1 adenylosuccinate lyase [Bacteroidota bacterium]
MELSPLSAISPVDGRYRLQTAVLAPYFSEEALMKYRVRVEVEYFIALRQLPLPQLDSSSQQNVIALREVYTEFSQADAESIKRREAVTNHDVKALEYFLKDKWAERGLGQYKEFIHFGLTSQDINNTAFPLAIKEAVENIYLPMLLEVKEKLNSYAGEWKNIPMLSRTHGQPASPTRLGKEISVFTERLDNQINLLKQIPFSAKFGGATGNFNAHHAAYPKIDWMAFANKFVKEQLGLSRLQTTTQIEHYDNLCALFDGMKRINNILIDLNRDIWTYISMDYFKQEIKSGEIGSSAMPHKVNPIDFENSEGNLGMANALFEHLSAKLPISRLQRDLTDSTVLRNVGVPFAHTVIALKSLLKGLGKLIVNKDALHKDLENNWAVVAEAIQTILRRENYPNPYEALKELTRTNSKITSESMLTFIEKLDVSDSVKTELKVFTPFNYTGI